MELLGHDVRRAILTLLRDGERSAGEIADLLGRKRPAISYHLNALLEASVVRVRRDGPRRLYVLDEPRALAAWTVWVGRSSSEREESA